ncbi:Sterol O-acyltransferase 2 (Sterol-ester synthase 2) [Tilletia horrida]|nr:Sterol O-acyltransferase 2 (Sterol-ester synthase 2) [Tilletia horrida]
MAETARPSANGSSDVSAASTVDGGKPAREKFPSSEPESPSTGSMTPDSEKDISTTTTVKTTTTEPSRSGSGVNVIESEARYTHLGAKGVTTSVGDEGSVHLQPTPASRRRGKKMRTLVSFRARASHFDRFNTVSSVDPFRGFYTLFWIGMFLTMLNTFYTSWSHSGQLISLTFAELFSKDAIVLALSDGVMVGSTFICVPFAKALHHGWRYWPHLIWFQHFWQALMLGAVIKWSRVREWPWVQSGFFVLHTLAMMMKIHSYMSINGAMADSYHKLRRIERKLESRVFLVEGGKEAQERDPETVSDDDKQKTWGIAVQKANARARSLESYLPPLTVNLVLPDGQGKASADATLLTRVQEGDEAWNSMTAQRGTSDMRHRQGGAVAARARRHSFTNLSSSNLAAASAAASAVGKASAKGPTVAQQELGPGATAGAGGPTPVQSAHASIKVGGGGGAGDAHGQGPQQRIPTTPLGTALRDPHPLSTHPDEQIAEWAQQIELIREDLMSASSQDDPISAGTEVPPRVSWPANVTYANFWDYLLVPTLVYELEYPRTKEIRPLYVLEKTLATFGTFFVIYVVTEHWIMPYQPQPSEPLLKTFLQLALPMMINYLLIFYIMFECICNAFAELTKFADREFYQDWWNATSMDVFSRKWNKPVHSFLLRHVYASSITAGIPKQQAMFITFLLSSLLHELVMAVVTGKIRGYLFAMQMAQLPLIVIGQIPFIRQNETLGNLIFWIGLMVGFPLLNILYITM